MTSLRRVLVAALKGLLKGKSFIQAILAFWVNPSSPIPESRPEGDAQPESTTSSSQSASSPSRKKGIRRTPSSSPKAKAKAQEPVTPSIPTKVTATVTVTSSPSSPSPSSSPASLPASPASPYTTSPPSSPDQQPRHALQRQLSPLHLKSKSQSTTATSIDSFLQDAERLLLEPVSGGRLQDFATGLQAQFRDRLLNNASCMLPSYNHQLPNGSEQGRFLSLDVGGSTLRVALIELRGKTAAQKDENMVILSKDTFKITPELKKLEGMDFFDWMAARILETVNKVENNNQTGHTGHTGPLPMGLAWSFPIEQTSLRGGILQGMGKGFRAADSLLGQDLGDIIQTACIGHGLHVQLAAIVNDSAAALLSEAYVHTTTRFGLILGTGVNIAVHLPVPAVGRAKFGARPAVWFNEASHVIINTELGMFGHGILPVTRWDALLNADHPKPEFQPLEHMVSGYYLGEVTRFALLEAVESAGLFGGIAPPSLLTPYALDTETLSVMATDASPSLEMATAVFHKSHPSASGTPPTLADIRTVCTLASLIAQRSAAIVGASVYALWALKAETEQEYIETSLIQAHTDNARAELAIVQARTVVAFNGSVIERYPQYLEQCQAVVNSLAATKPSAEASTIGLVPAQESSLLGAAVALACL
ncbi:N-acetylglucosamine kinase 1 [Sporothrix curviconia]|uniref:Phosphotransferase n=1 Tax=Sporothrix curviconia TaxID=1260050 RepID=A0ABP0C1H2_9PEZI